MKPGERARAAETGTGSTLQDWWVVGGTRVMGYGGSVDD